MKLDPLRLILLALLSTGLTKGLPAQVSDPFPASTAKAEGVSLKALAKLDKLVKALVKAEDIVGAELLVIKNGRSVMHEGYGWRDREAKTPMKNGGVFCVRSMTKPVVGAAILMLIDSKKLALADRVSKYLPVFDVEGTREITVEQLLTHTSGLPMSLLLGQDLKKLDGIGAVAALGGGHELAFVPGKGFKYSDQGTDTLTALVEVVSGMPAAEFVRKRVLDPLGMIDTACVMSEEHPLRDRGCSKYIGSRGAWTKFWDPKKPPLFPFFLGSQGLYSTLKDYARFMQFWQRGGRVGERRLLDAGLVGRALTPTSHAKLGATGLAGLVPGYGCLMQLWARPDDQGKLQVVVFGHTGSDGTYAWVFPEQNAMVLYFTQSRNNQSGMRVEEVLGELFLGASSGPSESVPPLEQFVGYYWEGEGDTYRAIIRDGEDLALEIPGRGVVPLTYMGKDRWKMRPNPRVVLAFDRAEGGQVSGYHIGDHQEFRFKPSKKLPGLDEVVERVIKAHRIDLLETLGPMRVRSKLEMPKIKVKGEVITLLAWPDRFRVDSKVADQFEKAAFDGKQVRYTSSSQEVSILDGARAAQTRLDSQMARFGDWRKWYSDLEVIQRLRRNRREIILVRAGGTSRVGITLYVDFETGRVIHEASIAILGPMGRIGRKMSFGDFRNVSGMCLPYRTKTVIANPLMGPAITKVTELKLGVEVAEGAFDLSK